MLNATDKNGKSEIIEGQTNMQLIFISNILSYKKHTFLL